MTASVSIVDYGLGNLHSVANAIRKVGAEAKLAPTPEDVLAADRLILPGVGAFGDGMAGLATRGLVDAIRAFVAKGRPLLGICLGMQLLLTEGEEFGVHVGLDIIPGRVVRVPGVDVKVPHVGWNALELPRLGASWRGSVLEDLEPGAMVYFVHSFTAMPTREEDRLADLHYGGARVSAAVKHENVTGCQFHPEKSAHVGQTILARFVASP